MQDDIALSFAEIPKPDVPAGYCAAKVIHGRLIPPQQQILLYSADEWEAFIQEWIHSKQGS